MPQNFEKVLQCHINFDTEVAAFKEEMKAIFQMSDLGPLSYLGIEVHQDNSGITLRQTAYAKRVVELTGLPNCNPAITPMERLKLSRDSTVEEVDATQYRRLVWSLRYLAHTRSDLAFSVGYVSRFMQRSTTEHVPLCCGDSRPRSPLPEVPWSGTLRRVQRPRRQHRHQQEHERDPLLPRKVHR